MVYLPPRHTVLKEKPFLKRLIRNKSKRTHQDMIRKATSNQVRTLREVMRNAIGNPKIPLNLPKKHLKAIKKAGKHVYFQEFINPATSERRARRLLNQHGNGVFQSLLKLVPKALNIFSPLTKLLGID